MILQEKDYKRAAELLDCDISTIKAIAEVESGPMGGFNKDGSPIIRFEGHIFHKELIKSGIDPESVSSGNEDIIYKSWTNDHNGNQATEYSRLERAVDIDNESGLKSASFGMFQIMGFNHKACGFDDVYMFYYAMGSTEKQQLLSLVSYLNNTIFKGKPIAHYARNKQWVSFARAYNGPLYYKNDYDTKLEFFDKLYS